MIVNNHNHRRRRAISSSSEPCVDSDFNELVSQFEVALTMMVPNEVGLGEDGPNDS